MFWKREICPKCKTGRDSYRLDEHSESCPHIECLKNGRCRFYMPIDEPHRMGIFRIGKNGTKARLLKK